MTDAARRRWDHRHGAASYTSPAEPVPPGPLHGWEHLLPASGRALEVACGRGAAAVWLAARGLTVDAVDVSPVGLAIGAALARARGVTGVRWWEHDLDTGLPAGCAGPYDVVVCERFRDPVVHAAMVGVLGPGGLLAVSVLSEVGGPRGPFRARPGELRAAFPGLEVLAYVEGDGLASLLARRP